MLAVNAAVPGFSGWNAFNIYPTVPPYGAPADHPKLSSGDPSQQEPEGYPLPLSVATLVRL